MKEIIRTMIFSTRYVNDEHSFFSGAQFKIEKSILKERCLMKLRRMDSVTDVLGFFHISAHPEKLLEIATILQKEDSDYYFSIDLSMLEFLESEVCDFLQERRDHLSDSTINDLSKFIQPNAEYGYAYKETRAIEGQSDVLYRAIGTMHLPNLHGMHGMEWAEFLANHFSYGTKDKEQIYLCLHTGTDWDKEDKGYLKDVSENLSSSLSKNVDVFLFHHQPDNYVIAAELLNREAELPNVWKVISSIKDYVSL